MGTTAAEHEGFVLDVSGYLFRLTTECLRLFSNETNEHQTLVSLVAARLAEPGAAGRHEVRTMREHFAAIPTHGDVKIRLPLSDANAQALEEMRQALGRRLDTTLTIGDALSALLFDYVVELKTSQILDRLSLEQRLDGGEPGRTSTRLN
ncbi:MULTISPECIES: hypothetical protein [Sphingomonadales]|uniref:Uncharacterized protein n=5 Tax=Sphingomonadaceae TaxID=41297 RepID=A0A1E1F8C7_9SPHN|nr:MULTISPECIES: hypothetical protein [Sphingomonadaceae]EPR17166.1 hypothetical protein M527_17610 [Sphingobium indicum IP26]EZP70286.1 hypothetical protein BV96_03529 [Sphingomonas paucimobilis]AMK20549.1 hypothetical protein K663_20963 [Sphingobium sp. MI1205]AMK21345.1 hypothetical protein K426_01920 [Sphingobium sp. TKS]EQB07766.1 hypothetical protein L286_03045 [Sphingobium sp. HDIP04]